MKYRNDLIGKKILIICNSIGSSYKRLYCSYVLGEITGYDPATNKIMVIRNTGHIGSAVEFKMNNHDPFEYKKKKKKRLYCWQQSACWG